MKGGLWPHRTDKLRDLESHWEIQQTRLFFHVYDDFARAPWKALAIAVLYSYSIVKMPLSLDDLIRDLGADTSVSSKLEVGVEDAHAIALDLTNAPETWLTDLAVSARRNNTVTHLTCVVDDGSADGFSSVAHVLLRELSQVAALEVSYAGLADTTDIGLVSAFLEGCLYGLTRLTSLAVRMLDTRSTTKWQGTFDWSIFNQLSELRRLDVLCGRYFWSMPLRTVMGVLTCLKHLDRVVIRGIRLDGDSISSAHGRVFLDFLRRRSLQTLHLDYLELDTGTVLRSLALGLFHSTIKHLHFSYSCNSVDESSLLLMAIGTCRELRTLWLQNMGTYPPFVGGATILRLNAGLTRLTLNRYKISDEEALNISSELVRPSCLLESLDLGCCQVPHTSMGILLASQNAHTCLRDLRLFRSITTSFVVGHGRSVSQGLDEPMIDHLETTLSGLVNVPLRSLCVRDPNFRLHFDRERSRAVGMSLFGNYYLETIEIDYLDDDCRELMYSLARLNAAGRRYLLSCRSRKAGVELLGKVSSNINDIFLHLCENPSLFVY